MAVIIVVITIIIVVDIINSYYQSQVFHENKKSIKIVIFKTDYCI